MKLTAVFLFSFSLLAGAVGHAQITLSEKNVPMRKVFREIQRQSGYGILCTYELMENAGSVSVHVKNVTALAALEICLKGKDLVYEVQGKMIVIKPAPPSGKFSADTAHTAELPIVVHGRVTDSAGRPMPGATIQIKGTKRVVTTDENGQFILRDAPEDTILIISFVGYGTRELRIHGNEGKEVLVALRVDAGEMEAAGVTVSNGYQKLPKERATGSFVQIDNKLFNRKVGPGVLDRLDGIVTGLLFTGGYQGIVMGPASNKLGMNIRGESTLSGKVSVDPLIILDNFPYAGDINNINPNDVESISILKDAAAASVWGAQSGNGVIVITTKKGGYDRPASIEINANLTIRNKPNLGYDRNFLKADSYMEVENYLFDKGYFDEDLANTTNYPALSPVVEILAKKRAGLISAGDAASQLDALKALDERNDYNRYVYQKALMQQYSLGVRGGGKNTTYSVSVGIDKNRDNLIRNGYDRVTVNSLNTYRPLKGLELTAGINYAWNKTLQNNGNGYGNGFVGGNVPSKYGNYYPYTRLADTRGNPLPVETDHRGSYIDSMSKAGFLDWHKRPLDEINAADNYTTINSYLLSAGIKYTFIPGLSGELQYSNHQQHILGWSYQSPEVYYTRYLINQFTQHDAAGNPVYIVPNGGILNSQFGDLKKNQGRVQLVFDRNFHDRHALTAMAAAELSEERTNYYSLLSYGYSTEYGTANNSLNFDTYYPTNPSGGAYIPGPWGGTTGTLNRMISYLANAGYTLDGKYTLTLSGKKDGANIFGAKTNDKITPLWSAGLGWNLSKEKFYNWKAFPFLRLRATYGFNGNVYNGSAYANGQYYGGGSILNGMPAIINMNPPNPDLRWEKIKNINLGLDFNANHNILSGSVEYFQRNGQDLIQGVETAPSAGFYAINSNSARKKSHGIDITVTSRNIDRDFKWYTTLLLTFTQDKVTRYDANKGSMFSGASGPGYSRYVVGKPSYALYAAQWKGLDPADGDPQGYLNGKISKDYSSILQQVIPDSLQYIGSSRPTLFGAFRNEFSYKGFSLSVNIQYKFGYFFRRSSISLNYMDILQNGGNVDYADRWRQPGDERKTNVPSLVYPNNPARDQFYQYSEILVEKGDHIRLQDIRLSYDIDAAAWKIKPFKSMQVYGYASNLGIIWRANGYHIDPDIPSYNGIHAVAAAFQLSFGVKLNY